MTLQVYTCLADDFVTVKGSDGRELDRKQLIYEGDFVIKNPAGESVLLQVTSEQIDKWAASFAQLAEEKIQVPVFASHNEHPDEKRGTLERIEACEDAFGRYTLWGYVSWTKPEYREKYLSTDVSICSESVYKTNSGEEITDRLRHVCLTDMPQIRKMFPFNQGYKKTTVVALSEDLAADLIGTPNTPQDDDAMDYLNDWAKLLGLNVADDSTEEDLIADVGKAIKELVEKSKDGKNDDTKVDDNTGPEPDMELSEKAIKYVKDQRTSTIDRWAKEGRLTAGKAKELREQASLAKVELSESGKDSFLALAETAIPDGPVLEFDSSTGHQNGSNSSSGESLAMQVAKEYS